MASFIISYEMTTSVRFCLSYDQLDFIPLKLTIVHSNTPRLYSQWLNSAIYLRNKLFQTVLKCLR